uniref:UspA domain-containing protein n=1 Tax=Nelumbo nucifera TaxID=4432 RepID=A0A822Z060_NELNU|nr:TPA_asm: hypothetical protein HUJ06_007530 [Nelumbo nucifera]
MATSTYIWVAKFSRKTTSSKAERWGWWWWWWVIVFGNVIEVNNKMGEEAWKGSGAAKKVMVVADPSRESTGALEWALSHALLEHDELILLHVERTSWRRRAISTLLKRPIPIDTSTSLEYQIGDLEFLEEMKNICKSTQPKVRVRIERVEMEGKDKDKAAAILWESKIHSVDILVIGQRRSLSTALLGCRLSRPNSGRNRGEKIIDIAEYLIENCKCTCVGVQKKGQNAGYVLNTKTYKNFWLLA